MQSIFSLNLALAKMGRLSSTAQKAIVGVTELHEALASNSFTKMTPEVWFDIYGSKKLTSAAVASALVARPLGDDQVSFVLKKERRSSVVSAMLRYNRLSESQIAQALTNKYIKEAVAETICSQGFARDESFPRDLRLKAASLSGHADWAHFLAFDSHATEKEALELFLSFSKERWFPRDSKGSFGRLLWRFPNLVKVCIAKDSAPALLQLACSSPVLRDPADQIEAIASAGLSETSHFPLLALANSPYASKEALEALGGLGNFSPNADSIRQSLARREQKSREPLSCSIEQVSDPDTLVWLVGRALPFVARDGRFSPAKAFELEALARNPHLTLEQARNVVEAMSFDHDVLRTFSTAEILSAVEVQYAKFSELVRQDVNVSREESVTYEVRGDPFEAQRQEQTKDPSRGSCVVLSSVDTYLRGESIAFLESQDLTVEQWRMLLEMAPMMPSVTVEELVQVVCSY